MKLILLVKKLLGLVEMTFGLVNASFNLPEWQAVNIFFGMLSIIISQYQSSVCSQINNETNNRFSSIVYNRIK